MTDLSKRVLILGGYGVFGQRLARLLVRDGHTVTIAGRDAAKARSIAADLACDWRAMDRGGDLSGLADFDVVVDAAGPFHTYGDDPYRLPRAAIDAGAHYLDLSDDAAFCQGVARLDTQARAAGRAVLSGLSSVPALSSAAVAALADGDTPRVIDSAILPGNRAPRGLSVMHSILAQAGRPMPLWRGNRWTRATGWSDPADHPLPGGHRRQGWLIEVPDMRLFPAHFGAETVRFRAGLELGLMRYGLAAFAVLRRAIPVPVGRPLVRAAKVAADLLSPFGTGIGGMSVAIQTDTERRTWSLLARGGDGPYIPAVPARALLRRAGLPPGAGPAIGTVTLDEAEAAMSDLDVVTERHTTPVTPIFARVLGPDFDALPGAIRQTHKTADRSHWQGRCSIERGRGLWPALLSALFRFPPPGDDIPVTVTKTATRQGEIWQRRFGRQGFRSHLAATPLGMTERFGPFTFLLGLSVREGALHYPVVAGRIGPVPMPRWLLPRSEACETAGDGTFGFDVPLYAPVTGALMVRYAGHLVPAPRDDPDAPPDLGR